jgi:hypothetical protein
MLAGYILIATGIYLYMSFTIPESVVGALIFLAGILFFWFEWDKYKAKKKIKLSKWLKANKKVVYALLLSILIMGIIIYFITTPIPTPTPSPAPIVRPVIFSPTNGSTVPISSQGLINTPIGISFSAVPNATQYLLEYNDGSFVLNQNTTAMGGPVIATSLKIPSEIFTDVVAGTYQLRIIGVDDNLNPVSEFSDPVSITLFSSEPQPIHITNNTTLNGTIFATTVSIPRGVLVTATDDLTILATDSVSINGSIIGEDGSPGASITIISISEITISGRIIAGNGINGVNSTIKGINGEDVVANGSDGADGGAITIISTDSNIILMDTAKIASGNGGEGGNVVVRGGTPTAVGANGGNVVAVAGAGGSGGTFTLLTLRGLIVVPQIEGILTIGNGGTGGSAYAFGGRGSDGNLTTLNGVGGSSTAIGGVGGASGNLIITTLDFDGDGVLTENDTLIIAGGVGGNGGGALAQAGAKGGAMQSSCPPTGGKDAPLAKAVGSPGGWGITRGGHGQPAVAIGQQGSGTGKGGDALAEGGKGGDIELISVGWRGIGIAIGLIAAEAGDGGYAHATGGPGGPYGGDGGKATAKGGDSGDAPIVIVGTVTTFGGFGGYAVAHGGKGQNGVSCPCEPPTRGQDGGNGGFADATGGKGGDGNVAGNGGDASAFGGSGGNGGDGCPPGFKGFKGGSSAVPGEGGRLFGKRGEVLADLPGKDGKDGEDCCKTYCGDGEVQKPNDQGQMEECEEDADCPYYTGPGGGQGKCIECKCYPPTYCGDGEIQRPNAEGQYEECDQPRTIEGGDCLEGQWCIDCKCMTLTLYCGDGIVMPPYEECDPGNPEAGVAPVPCPEDKKCDKCKCVPIEKNETGSLKTGVYDIYTGLPIIGAIVTVYVDGKEVSSCTITKATLEGCVIENLPIGKYTAMASAEGYQSEKLSLEIYGRVTTTIDFKLEPSKLSK